MDSSIITILIAVAIIGFQIYSEKKKKENAKARAMGIQPQQHTEEDPREKLRREISSLFTGVVPQEEEEDESYDGYNYDQENDQTPNSLYSEDPFESIVNKTEAPKTVAPLDIIHKYEGESFLNKSTVDGIAKSEQIDVTGDIYDSKAISEHNYTEEAAKPIAAFGKNFDPRLFIIYSELANPKFRD